VSCSWDYSNEGRCRSSMHLVDKQFGLAPLLNLLTDVFDEAGVMAA